MPLRLPPLTERASRILLEGIVDYAGLFPPSSVAMANAVRHYAHYRASETGWMLGRFVCAAAELEHFSAHAEPLLPRDAGALPWRLTVVGSAHPDVDVAAIAAFNERHRVCFDECGALVDAIELRVTTVQDVQQLHEALPKTLTTYFEVPLHGTSAATIDALVQEIARVKRRAKMRTGGVEAGAVPSPEAVVAFLAACVAHGVTAKATAGLHHALRGAYPLTDGPDAAAARMYGFVNVFLTMALLSGGGSERHAAVLLEESDPAAFAVNDLHVSWRGVDEPFNFDRVSLRQVRDHGLVSFGSCAFTEPVAEARALGWL